MIRNYTKPILMLLSAFMLMMVSLQASSTEIVGTSNDLTYESSYENYELDTSANASYQAGRRAGRAVGRFISSAAFLAAELAYEAATYLLGSAEQPDTVTLDPYSSTDLTEFDN
ncbi:MAG: hypothetical protein AAGK97_06650 [Bacteroidota bacterium]